MKLAIAVALAFGIAVPATAQNLSLPAPAIGPPPLGVLRAVSPIYNDQLNPNIGPLGLQAIILSLQAQVNRLQTRLDGAAETYIWADINGIIEDSPGMVRIIGWGLSCSGDYQLAVEVDGVQSVQNEALAAATGPGQFFRYDRPDVRFYPDLVNACAQVGKPVPIAAGFQVLVDMAPFEPGWQGTRAHTFRIRVYDGAGRLGVSPVRAFTTTR